MVLEKSLAATAANAAFSQYWQHLLLTAIFVEAINVVDFASPDTISGDFNLSKRSRVNFTYVRHHTYCSKTCSRHTCVRMISFALDDTFPVWRTSPSYEVTRACVLWNMLSLSLRSLLVWLRGCIQNGWKKERKPKQSSNRERLRKTGHFSKLYHGV